MIVFRPCILLCAALTLCVGAESVDAVLLSQRAAAVSGRTTLAGDGLAVGDDRVAWSSLVAAGFATPPSGSLDQGVLTVGGDLLRGVPRSLSKATLLFAGDLHGQRELPLTDLAAIVFGPVRSQALETLAAGEAGALLANGDRVAGQLVFINDEAIGIDTGRRVAQVPRARVTVVTLRPMAPAVDGGPWLLLSSGDRLRAETLAQEAGALVIQSAGGRLALPLSAFSAMWRDDARCVALARRVPLRVRASDRQGESLVVAGIRPFPVFASGRAAAQGIELPANGEIAWSADKAAFFVAWVASVPGCRSSLARVVVDGAVAWEGTVTAGAAALPVRIPLNAAREVALLCPPAPDGASSGQAILWCHPTLVH